MKRLRHSHMCGGRNPPDRLLGANTYAQSKDRWPSADEQGEYGEKLNNLTKFVASPKLEDDPWGDFSAAPVTRDPAATIREFQEHSGKDIWLWGRSSRIGGTWSSSRPARR